MKLPPTVSLIVTRFDRLKQLRDRAEQLRELDLRLRTCVPAPLSTHIRLATIRDGCLVIHADSSSWAAQLRYKTPELLAMLAADPAFEPILSIRVRPRAESTPPERVGRRPSISPECAAELEAQASSIEDGGVRDALMRLAGHGRG